MKISRLYIKYFIIVMAIVFSSHLLVSGLFRIVSLNSRHIRIENDLAGIVFLVKDLVSSNLATAQVNDPQHKNLSQKIQNLSKEWSGRIWIEDNNGRVIVSNENTPRPALSDEMKQRKNYRINLPSDGHPDVLLEIPVNYSLSSTAKVYVALNRPAKNDYLFFVGISIISVLVLLILFPLSRKITVPLNRLTESANAVSRGEFSLHVDETSSDEIGQLARAFNRMSEKVLQMIRGTKELTANISHQIRSPLARINIAVGIMHDQLQANDHAGAVRTLSMIESETAEIDNLTGRIIELIKADIAHKKNEYMNIDLWDAAKNICDRFSERMKKKSINHIEYESSAIIKIAGVYNDICELLDILYDNALKYTPENGSIKLRVFSENSKAVLSLCNSGTQLNDNDLKQIFEPFARKVSSKFSGYGLGLAIARRIVENHNGSICARNSNDGFEIRVEFEMAQ